MEDHKSVYQKLLEMDGLLTLGEKVIALQTFKILNKMYPPYLTYLVKICEKYTKWNIYFPGLKCPGKTKNLITSNCIVFQNGTSVLKSAE